MKSFMQFAQDHEGKLPIFMYFAYRKSIETQDSRQGQDFSEGKDVSLF